METAMFGAGCFWHVEETFRHVEAVKETAVGYSGGKTENPTYEQVCSHTTGHAEVVQVKFDPREVSYDQLLKVFFDCHDPTTPNRQGPDVGTNYRSVIFYYTPEQKAAAEAAKKRLDASGKYSHPVVTQIAPAQKFWRAEDYHQHYLEKQGRGSCRLP